MQVASVGQEEGVLALAGRKGIDFAGQEEEICLAFAGSQEVLFAGQEEGLLALAGWKGIGFAGQEEEICLAVARSKHKKRFALPRSQEEGFVLAVAVPAEEGPVPPSEQKKAERVCVEV